MNQKNGTSTALRILPAQQDQPITLKLSGEFDLSNADTLRIALDEVFEQTNEHGIIIDLTDVSYIDCDAIRIIIIASQQCKETGTKMTLAVTKGAVLRVLTITGLIKLLDIEIAPAPVYHDGSLPIISPPTFNN